MDQFISNAIIKMPAMKVTVTDPNGNVTKIYDAPPGFQLDKYVLWLYPDAIINIDYPDKNISV